MGKKRTSLSAPHPHTFTSIHVQSYTVHWQFYFVERISLYPILIITFNTKNTLFFRLLFYFYFVRRTDILKNNKVNEKQKQCLRSLINIQLTSGVSLFGSTKMHWGTKSRKKNKNKLHQTIAAKWYVHWIYCFISIYKMNESETFSWTSDPKQYRNKIHKPKRQLTKAGKITKIENSPEKKKAIKLKLWWKKEESEKRHSLFVSIYILAILFNALVFPISGDSTE